MGDLNSDYNNMNSYKAIRQRRDEDIIYVSSDPKNLNLFHDHILNNTINIAIDKVKSEMGPAPSHFAFFMMGSGGRFEQSVWSDQDHGIIFDGPDEHKPYFLALGNEIMNALEIVGYEICDGKVMASNPLWCNSLRAWKDQILNWLNEESWVSLRYFSIFFDSRVLLGEERFLLELKQLAFSKIEENPNLYHRLLDNVGNPKKGIGIFGQLLPELHGPQEGTIHLKQTVFFPYVNSLRLLALKEKITYPSTLSRFKHLPSRYGPIKHYKEDFIKLLNYRLYFQKDAKSYQKVHLLNIKTLSTIEKREIKQIMKKGQKLFSETRAIIEKGCSTWS